MFRFRYIALRDGVEVDVVLFLIVEPVGIDRLRKTVGFPDPEMAIPLKQTCGSWFRLKQIAPQFACRMAFETVKDSDDIWRFDQKMQMIEHEDIGMDAKATIGLTPAQAFGENVPSLVAVEEIVPVSDGRRYEMDLIAGIMGNSQYWHSRLIARRFAHAN